jgi:hypothetical protein
MELRQRQAAGRRNLHCIRQVRNTAEVTGIPPGTSRFRHKQGHVRETPQGVWRWMLCWKGTSVCCVRLTRCRGAGTSPSRRSCSFGHGMSVTLEDGTIHREQWSLSLTGWARGPRRSRRLIKVLSPLQPVGVVHDYRGLRARDKPLAGQNPLADCWTPRVVS